LAAAAAGIALDAAAREAWIETQKQALKAGRLDAVLHRLAAHREAPEACDEQAPVRCCHVWTAPSRQGGFDVLRWFVSAVMSSAFCWGNCSRWP
jgi:hypothetical protein